VIVVIVIVVVVVRLSSGSCTIGTVIGIGDGE
jgi:hypothetical protein